MTDVLTKKQRSYNMSQIRAKNTKPEIKFRKLLSDRGIKNYKTNYSSLLGKPDMIFIKNRVVVFIDGCFWHKCSKHFIKPKSNIKFWENKINENVRRDKEVNTAYKNAGLKIIRIWTHRLKQNLSGKFLNNKNILL